MVDIIFGVAIIIIIVLIMIIIIIVELMVVLISISRLKGTSFSCLFFRFKQMGF